MYAYLSRSTLNCGLSGKELDNRLPATSFISLHWFYLGSVELPAADEGAPARELPRRLVISKQGPIVTRNRGEILYFGISMYPDAFAVAFGVAAKDLEGRFADASEVLPAHGMAMFDAIGLASSDEGRLALFEDSLQTHAGDFRVSLWTAALRATRNALGVSVAEMQSRTVCYLQRFTPTTVQPGGTTDAASCSRSASTPPVTAMPARTAPGVQPLLPDPASASVA